MGAWGTSLYANDSACDIRGDYVDKLKHGKSNEDAVSELMLANQSILEDEEEAPLFWFALADTQWNYGRLLPEVKEKALYFLSQDKELARWQESGQKQLQEWKTTLAALEQKLTRPQPPEKKISKYRIYRCKWKLGDVFAYQFTGEYSKEKRFQGQYVIFRKVSEDSVWPGHIVPVVQFYKWIGSQIPDLTALSKMPLLEQNFYPSVLMHRPDTPKVYNVILISTSPNAIPRKNLSFLGNLPGKDLLPFRGPNFSTSYQLVGWESSKFNAKIEHYIIDMYLAWKCE